MFTNRLMDEKNEYSHIMEHDLAIKRNEILAHRTTWMNVKFIMLNAGRQRRIICMILFM